jgi:CRISPR-associated protein Cmx8
VPDRTVELTYDPFVLPTAQHRAGLAGLMVLVESLRKRKIKPVPEVIVNHDQTISVRIIEDSLTVLFNDLYDATMGEAASNTTRKDKCKRLIPPLREEKKLDPKTGKEKTVYIYPQVIPKGKFLATFGLPEVWLKLWRDAIWGTLRGVPKTRLPYEQRAEKGVPAETRETWKMLQRFQEAREKNKFYTVSIASSSFVGAQAENAERIPFRGRADEAFLLHFWPVVMGVYVPEIIERDGKTKFSGYVLAIPDVSDHNGFVQDFGEALAQLGTQMAGYRPKQAVVALPQEGGLEYLHHLLGLVQAQADIANVTGVEVFHLEKRGNSIHMLGADRVPVARRILEQYEAIRDKYYSVLFRRQMILNLIRGKPWYRDFERVFAKSSKDGFIGPKAHKFSSDVRRRFEVESQARRSV